MLRIDNRASVPVFSIIDRMEQKAAMGINCTTSTVIFKNKSLQAVKISLSILEYFPIIPTAIPNNTAKKNQLQHICL